MTIEEELFSRHRGRTVLLDSNLLLLLLAGSLGLDFFRRFPRVSGYDFDDYELLNQALKSFGVILTTPHVLTEISNLANKLSGTFRSEWSEYLARFVTSGHQAGILNERWIPARDLAQTGDFIRFGITDCAIGGVASDALVLTDDYGLSGSLRSRGLAVLNFKDLRSIRGELY